MGVACDHEESNGIDVTVRKVDSEFNITSGRNIEPTPSWCYNKQKDLKMLEMKLSLEYCIDLNTSSKRML